MTISLDELKAENAAEEAQSENNQDVTEQGALDDKNVNDDVIDDADIEQDNGTEDGSEEGEKLESWQQTEVDASESDQSGFVPNAEAAKRRKQNTALRGTVKEKDTEIELLRKELEEAKSVNAPVQTAPTLSTRPTREGCGYDEDAYDVALDAWNDEKLDLKIKSMNQTANQNQQQEQKAEAAKQQIQNSLNDHYARAEKLVSDGKVKQEIFQAADGNVRNAIESVFNGAGNEMTDQIIARLNDMGSGSEKVVYLLGRNTSKLNELTGLLQKDPTGLSAMGFLGKLHSEVQDPQKRRSNAPKPANKLTGDAAATSSHGTMFKKWSKSTDPQTRIDLKSKAKAAGEDVSSWKW